MRDLQLPGRSVVHATSGAAATSHPFATLAAIRILQEGGNAVDAAVAACAVQCVVEPMMTGIGGDCFVLLQKGGAGPVIGLNGSGRAPAALEAAALRARGVDHIGLETPESVTVPGAVDAWCRLLDDHGALGRDRVLAPAIAYARDGFAVLPRTAVDWAANAARLTTDPHAPALYLKDGRAPVAGDTWRSPQLAETLAAAAREGREAFYAGPRAAAMVAALNARGGVHTEADFAATACDYVEPIATGYAGHQVLEIPPAGQGVTALVMLNLLARAGLKGLDPLGADRLHLEIEAARLAYALRDRHVADPEQAEVPLEFLLSDDLAAELHGMISPGRAMGALPPLPGPAGARAKGAEHAVGAEHKDTVYLTVVDRDLNCVSFINSLFHGFGSCIACPETGVVFQNRGACFVLEDGHPNCLAPGKRPLHTIIPGMALDGQGRCEVSFGVMGGDYQPVGHAHVLTNLFDFGMDVQEAIDCPRVFPTGGTVEVERGVPAAVGRELAARGHAVVEAGMPWGGGQAIVIDHARGTLAAGSDPRKDGCALGY